MKRFIALLMALVCMSSFACAEGLENWINTELAQPITEMFEEGTLITTAAMIKVQAENDIAILTFDIKTEGETVAQANQLVTAQVTAIKNILIAQGVEENNIWNKCYDVSPNVVYHNSRLTSGQVIDGYMVEIELSVRLTDLSMVGVVIDAAMQSGAGSAHDLIFEKSKAGDAYSAALAEAAKLAMEKAAALAESCGLTLGELVSVKEASTYLEDEAKVEVTYRAK